MIYYLCKYVLEPIEGLEWFRLASYISIRSIVAAITAFCLILFFGNRLIRYLYLRGIRDTMHDYGFLEPESKRGTPTMGGILVVGAVFVAILLWNDPANPFVQWLLAAMLWFGAVGFIDDYLKVKHGDSRKGLSQITKLGLQSLFAVVFMLAYLSESMSPLSPERVRLLQGTLNATPEDYRFYLQLPFYKYPVVNLSWLYLPFGLFDRGCLRPVRLYHRQFQLFRNLSFHPPGGKR